MERWSEAEFLFVETLGHWARLLCLQWRRTMILRRRIDLLCLFTFVRWRIAHSPSSALNSGHDLTQTTNFLEDYGAQSGIHFEEESLFYVFTALDRFWWYSSIDNRHPHLQAMGILPPSSAVFIVLIAGGLGYSPLFLPLLRRMGQRTMGAAAALILVARQALCGLYGSPRTIHAMHWPTT